MTHQRLFVFLVTAVVTATAAYGFWLSGSPSAERARRLDAQRLNDLQQISYGMDRYWELNRKLPSSLEEAQRMRHIFVGNITDPETRDPYAFVRQDEDTYDLCAHFSLPSSAKDQAFPSPYPIQGPRENSFWNHAADRVCFTIDVTTSTTKEKWSSLIAD